MAKLQLYQYRVIDFINSLIQCGGSVRKDLQRYRLAWEEQ